KSGTNTPHGSVFWYNRNDAFDSPNSFDISKSALSQNQFGGSLGAPIVRNRTFIFGSYEGYRLKSGINFVEAAPSAAAFARAVPAVAPLFDAFRASRAVVLSGASTNPDFDILQLQDNAKVNEDSLSVRLDQKMTPDWTLYGRYFQDEGTNDQPEGITGRRSHITDTPRNAIIALQGILSPTILNELKFGYNAAPSVIAGSA